MPREEYLAYLACIPEVEALEELRYRNWQHPLTPDRAKELVWLTTKNLDAAERAWAKQINALDRLNSPLPKANLPSLPSDLP